MSLEEEVVVIVPTWAECPRCGCVLVGLPADDASDDDLCHQCAREAAPCN